MRSADVALSPLYSRLENLSTSAREELAGNILPFWPKHGRDLPSKGFFGSLRYGNEGDAAEPRSVVMTARHLWTYSAASRVLNDSSWMDTADYAYAALTDNFVDRKHGGVFWSVHADGSPCVEKKQIYGEAFALYAFSEYARALAEVRKDGEAAAAAFDHARAVWNLLETHARDRSGGGYVEARARDWSATTDLKLSGKDIDCAKSMNTNLHVVEAYTAFYRTLSIAFPDDIDLLSRVAASLATLVRATTEKIIGSDGHLDLYFTQDWKPIGDIVSFGHDIEASWLLWEAACELKNAALKNGIREAVLRLAEISLAEGVSDASGALDNEIHGGRRDSTRVWWCQAEAVVGFFNAWQISSDERFLDAAEKTWNWIMTRQKDAEGGDWHASVAPDGRPLFSELKGGNWKTGYHNGRCCMELIERAAHSGAAAMRGQSKESES